MRRPGDSTDAPTHVGPDAAVELAGRRDRGQAPSDRGQSAARLARDEPRGTPGRWTPCKDGIPSIDAPKFEAAAAVQDDLSDGDIVIGVYRNGQAKAYPQSIVVWHEIVNDTVGGTTLAITYCPLTGTALGFKRGDTELGVSGKLINSNLAMYGRPTDTEYPQILGAGITPPNAGTRLAEVRVFWTTWGNWRKRYPDTRVLTTETGYMRDDQRDPYGGYNPRRGYYAKGSRRLFPVRHESERYPDKHVVLGFRGGEQAVAVDKLVLRQQRVLRHESAGDAYLVVDDPGLDTGWVYRGAADVKVDLDGIRFTQQGPRFDGRDDLDRVNAFEAMWFAWAASYPDTAVLDG